MFFGITSLPEPPILSEYVGLIYFNIELGSRKSSIEGDRIRRLTGPIGMAHPFVDSSSG